MQYKFNRNVNLRDSNAYDGRFTQLTKSYSRTTNLKAGYVIKVKEEPLYKQSYVTIQLLDGGIIEDVPFPSPNVLLNQTGMVTGQSKMIHGLYEPIMPGHYVVVGFLNGNANSPIILNRYQYKAIPIGGGPIDNLFVNPLTKLNFQTSDIILGHYTGSYMSIHSKLPLPGHFQISSVSSIEIKSKLGITIKSQLEVSIKGDKSIDLKAGKTDATSSKISMDGIISKIEIQSTIIEIKPKTGGMLKLGSNPSNFCNNLPNCLFTGAPHSTSTDVLV